MDPIIIDDFLPEIYIDSIYSLMGGDQIPWSFAKHSVSSDPNLESLFYTDEPVKEHIQFRHIFIDENKIKSAQLQYIAPLIACYENVMGKIKYTERIKANLLLPQAGPTRQQPHTDGMRLLDGVYNSVGRKTLLYYVNDADGDTIFYDKNFLGEPLGLVKEQQRVAPKKGRAVIFDSNLIHSGSCPTTIEYRMVINCVLN
jgi:hypothetical protein